MAYVTHLKPAGNLMTILWSNGDESVAYPTQGALWIVDRRQPYNGDGPDPNPDPDPDPPPDPEGDWYHPLGGPWPWTTYDDGGRSHSGGALDFPCGTETPPLYAATTGPILYAGWEDGGGGNVVIIGGPAGEGIVYAHMSSIDVSTGQTVQVGDKVGNVGTTGSSTGNHLHLEVRQHGTQWGPWYPAYQYFLDRGINLG